MDTNEKSSFMDKYLTPIAVVLGCIIIAVAVAFGQGGTSKTNGDQPLAADIKDVDTDSGPFIGEKGAPVVMAVWFDYQCPFCKQFELTTMAEINENYVKTGKVKVVFKDFQFLDEYSKNPERVEDSITAAVFGRAVWDAHPDRYHDWFKAMAENQDEEFGGFGDFKSIEALTRTIPGIDGDRVLKLVTDKRAEYEAAIAADRAEGQALGINGTPSMIIGTTLLSGAETYAKISGLLDAELAQ